MKPFNQIVSLFIVFVFGFQSVVFARGGNSGSMSGEAFFKGIPTDIFLRMLFEAKDIKSFNSLMRTIRRTSAIARNPQNRETLSLIYWGLKTREWLRTQPLPKRVEYYFKLYPMISEIEGVISSEQNHPKQVVLTYLTRLISQIEDDLLPSEGEVDLGFFDDNIWNELKTIKLSEKAQLRILRLGRNREKLLQIIVQNPYLTAASLKELERIDATRWKKNLSPLLKKQDVEQRIVDIYSVFIQLRPVLAQMIEASKLEKMAQILAQPVMTSEEIDRVLSPFSEVNAINIIFTDHHRKASLQFFSLLAARVQDLNQMKKLVCRFNHFIFMADFEVNPIPTAALLEQLFHLPIFNGPTQREEFSRPLLPYFYSFLEKGKRDLSFQEDARLNDAYSLAMRFLGRFAVNHPNIMEPLLQIPVHYDNDLMKMKLWEMLIPFLNPVQRERVAQLAAQYLLPPSRFGIITLLSIYPPVISPESHAREEAKRSMEATTSLEDEGLPARPQKLMRKDHE